MKTYILISHLSIHNANALSSAFTIGVPAMTAWLGAVHAMQRTLHCLNEFSDLTMDGVAVSFHDYRLQTYCEPHDRIHSIIGTANPLRRKKGTNDVERPPFIEEGRIDLDVSLLIEVQGLNPTYDDLLKEKLYQQIQCMKFAGGDVISSKTIEILSVLENDDTENRDIILRLMPGFVLTERRDLLCLDEEGDSLQSLLSYLYLYAEPISDEKENISWEYHRKCQGWIVPICVGFKGITPLGKVKGQRDGKVDHQFAEPLVTLGEFKMAYRFNRIEDMMWRYQYDSSQSLYVCVNQEHH
jgi:CRISPR-associated protein Csy2